MILLISLLYLFSPYFFLTYMSMTWTYCTWSYSCSNSLRWMILALLTTYCHWSSLFSQLIPCTIIFCLPVSLPSVPSTQLTNSFTKDPTTFLIFIIELPMFVAVKLSVWGVKESRVIWFYFLYFCMCGVFSILVSRPSLQWLYLDMVFSYIL